MTSSDHFNRTRRRYLPIIKVNRLKELTNKLMHELESETTTSCPLENLYNSKRTCTICTKLRSESKFLYPTVCSHVFCVDCVEMALRIDRYPYRCMMCRSVCSTFTYVAKEGERYRIKLYRIEERKANIVRDNDDIASLILDEEVLPE